MHCPVPPKRSQNDRHITTAGRTSLPQKVACPFSLNRHFFESARLRCLHHLGFSYVLGWAPGGMTFEKSAFKLTRDVVDVWGGRGSPIYDEFTNVMVQVSSHTQPAYELTGLLAC